MYYEEIICLVLGPDFRISSDKDEIRIIDEVVNDLVNRGFSPPTAVQLEEMANGTEEPQVKWFFGAMEALCALSGAQSAKIFSWTKQSRKDHQIIQRIAVILCMKGVSPFVAIAMATGEIEIPPGFPSWGDMAGVQPRPYRR